MDRKPRDEAVSPVIATIVLVAIAIVLSGVLYTGVGRPATMSADAAAVAITAAPPDAPNERTFIVSAATPGLDWGRLRLSLDGEPLTYDGALAAEATWCLRAGSACVATASFDPASSVQGGQKLRVHDADVAGGRLELVDVEANSILARVSLRE